MYKVIKYFTDLQDNNHQYNVGDQFPRTGVTVTEARFAELAGKNNLQKTPLIQAVAVKEEPQEAPKKKRAKKTAEQ